MSNEKLLGKLSRFNSTIDKRISPDLNFFQRTGILFDFASEYLFHGAYLHDYCDYGFYYKKRADRRNYIVFNKLLEIVDKLNDKDKYDVMSDKFVFNKTYKDYLGRSYLDTTEASLEEFKDFLSNKEAIFVKEYDGSCGIGVDKIYVSDIDDVEALYNEYKDKHILCEEVLTQCDEMSEFNDTSINTLRIVTILNAQGEVDIIGGLLRMGRKGRIADNFHHNGIVAYLDGETGIVSTTGINKDDERFIKHPDSGKQIVGFNVPVWDKVVTTVKNAALVTPEIRYTGWDVVIDKDYNVVIIEGNFAAEPDGEQVTTCTGRWPIYKKYIDEIASIKDNT